MVALLSLRWGPFQSAWLSDPVSVCLLSLFHLQTQPDKKEELHYQTDYDKLRDTTDLKNK